MLGLREVSSQFRAQVYTITLTAPNADERAAALTVASNPAGAGQPLTLTGRAGQTLQLQVLDAVGRVHHNQPPHPATTTEQLPLTLPGSLPAGVYLLRVSGPGTAPLQTRLVLTR
ncbi:hypothetical protein [Hymenobacter lapidiphilus]|uniref:T9SS type A sorting domain-containing protein n=1 Tax=Hymenobacter lapidiphilus TaxID=2608003 RepID=A0A7Y7PRS5_9BACT|nr:hypothetical protein [Hymenobacter lapidiphilus]NVO32860.1 hypothetical protein [Hymenobacter lapidiphilus]